MAQTKRDSTLDTRTNRLKLPARKEPYWSKLGEGRFLGYYRPGSKAAGSWVAKWRDAGTGARKKSTLGTADDFTDASGEKVLTWTQANDKARAWFDVATHEAVLVAGGEVLPKGAYTVADALREYFEDGRRRGVKGLERDEQRAGAHILPELGPLSVATLTRTRLESWLAKVAESPRRVRTKAPLPEGAQVPVHRNFKTPRPPKPEKAPPAPPSSDEEKRQRKDSANRVLTVLKAALNQALDRRRVQNGEAWQSVKPYRGTTKARVRFLSVEEQARLVNVCPGDFRRLVQAALLTGARYGELARVRVEDYNATAGTVFIAESKNGKSRHVVLTEEGATFFEEQTAGMVAGDQIFTREGVKRRKRKALGATWGHSDQARFMKVAYMAAKLDPLAFHELRHSYASMLVNRGVPLAYVAAQLGHDDTRMVEKHYGHLAPSAMADSIRALAPRLGIVEPSKVAALKVNAGA